MKMGARTFHRASCLAFYLSFGPKYTRRDAKKEGETRKRGWARRVERCHCTLSTLGAERRAPSSGHEHTQHSNCNIMQRSLRSMVHAAFMVSWENGYVSHIALPEKVLTVHRYINQNAK